MIKVTFTAEDGYKTYSACFSSMRLVTMFEERWQNTGGFRRFGMDIHGKTTEPLPILPCNKQGFRKVYLNLYGEDSDIHTFFLP
jgi:hypothetical protein